MNHDINTTLLGEARKKEAGLSFKDLPLPEDMPADLKMGAKAPMFDSKLYLYPELVKKLGEIPAREKVPTFFEPVDDLIDGGFHGGELVVLSAQTKHGKSTLAQTFSFLQALNGIPTLWFSMEMSWQELTRKFLAMDEDNLLSSLAAVKPPSDLAICYPIQNRGLEMGWLENQIVKAKKEYGARMVYIDHLHFLIPLKDFQTNISFIVGSVVRELKQIAVRHDIPILLIAHMRKLEDVSKRPDINTIRDSSFTSQESDFTFIMWRRRKKGFDKTKELSSTEAELLKETEQDIYENNAVLSLEANRRTGKTKRMLIEYRHSRFFPITKEAQIAEQLQHMHDKTPERAPTMTEQEIAEEQRKAAALLADSIPKTQESMFKDPHDTLTKKVIEAL